MRYLSTASDAPLLGIAIGLFFPNSPRARNRALRRSRSSLVGLPAPGAGRRSSSSVASTLVSLLLISMYLRRPSTGTKSTTMSGVSLPAFTLKSADAGRSICPRAISSAVTLRCSPLNSYLTTTLGCTFAITVMTPNAFLPLSSAAAGEAARARQRAKASSLMRTYSSPRPPKAAGDLTKACRPAAQFRQTANNSSFSTACASTLPARAPGMVEAPRPAARCGEIEEHEAVKRGQLPAVEQGPEALSGVCHEIGECHLAAKNESDRPSEQPDEQQRAADQLERSRQADQREQRRRAGYRRGKAEQLLRAVRHEEKRVDNAQHAQQARRPAPGSNQPPCRFTLSSARDRKSTRLN